MVPVPMVNYTRTCLAEDVCDYRYGLTCVNQTCTCLSSSQYYNGTSCTSLLGYSANCSSSMQCNSFLGLSCSSSACNCNSTQYFNGTTCGKINNTILFF